MDYNSFIDNILQPYSIYLDEWKKALFGSDIERLFADKPQASKVAVSLMTDGNSRLFHALIDMMMEKGVNPTLMGVKVKYLDAFFFLSGKAAEIDDTSCRELMEMLGVGKRFADILINKAVAMGADCNVALQALIGRPKGRGVLTTCKPPLLGLDTCKKLNESANSNIVCSGNFKPQEATKGNGLIVEPQQAAQGQQIGNIEPQPIPKELDNDEAKTYFKKAVELGLMTDDFRWLKGLQMLACFAREMSHKMNLGKGERISWKPFEILFCVSDGKLRLNYNDIQKTGQGPREAYLIDKIFE